MIFLPTPEIIKKDSGALLREMEGKAPFYTPEWKPGDLSDFGGALSRIFAYFSGLLIQRLNYVPQRHFLGFLETIGASLLPAQTAKAPITFVLSSGASENVLIPALTQVAAQGVDGKPIVFETEENTVATPAKLTALFSVVPRSDWIFDHKNAINGADSTDLFIAEDIHTENIQEHILLLGDKNLFNVKHAKLSVTFDGVDATLLAKLAETSCAVWGYGTEVMVKENGKEVKKLEWHNFSEVQLNSKNSGLLLFKGNDEPISEVELFKGMASRWVRCAITDSKIEEVEGIRIRSLLKASTSSEGRLTVLVRMVQGIGEEFCRRLEHEGITTVDELLKFTPEELSEKLQPHCSTMRALNILEAARKVFYDKTGRTGPVKTGGIPPDLIFCNDVPVDLSRGFYPFGKKPQLSSSLFIASDDAFSKKGYTVDMYFTLTKGMPFDADAPPQLSWEYWDGEGWMQLEGVSENFAVTGNACKGSTKPSPEVSCTVSISPMPELKETKVNGKEHYWVRVRLVGGDYGKEYDVTATGVTEGKYCPPEIQSLNIQYRKDGDDSPEYILSKNNCVTEIIKDAPFIPFKSLPDAFPAVYFGFDRALKGGPIGLFVSIDESFEYPEDFRPRIKWHYCGEGESDAWSELDVLDGTEGFTKSGIIRFAVPAGAEMKSRALLGDNPIYWLRASITEDFFEVSGTPSRRKVLKGVLGKLYHGLERADLLKGPSMDECKGGVEVYNFGLVNDTLKKLPPHVLGLYLNAAWAVQSRTITNEMLGSSTGKADQVFALLNLPVVSESIWVNEAASLSEGERESLRRGALAIEEKRDEKGNVAEFWVKWKEVDDFIDSGSDRHYVIDRASGGVLFGDGAHGMIPPLGKDNIRAAYSSGGGKAGNLHPCEIKKLQSPLAFIDKVYNPAASEGGNDAEDISSLLRRVPAVLENRRRAVAREDFQWIAQEASRDIARVKVLPNFDETGNYRTGWVTVVIVPEGMEENPMPSPALKRKVKNYLSERCPNVATIKVLPPSYVRADISAELITGAIAAIPVIEYEARRRLSGFLHPLTGGEEEKGWEFGSAPCISDLYSLLENVPDVDYVKSVLITLFTREGERLTEVTDTSGVIRLPDYSLIYSGTHTITARLET